MDQTGVVAANKTQPTTASVGEFIASLGDRRREADSNRLIDILRRVTNCEPVMWGSAIVGFDRYHYRYASGREGDAAVLGFSPRATQLTLYLPGGFDGLQDQLSHLGRHRTAVSCLYIKRLEDVDLDILEEVFQRSFDTFVPPGS
jgi:hypothetical protein